MADKLDPREIVEWQELAYSKEKGTVVISVFVEICKKNLLSTLSKFTQNAELNETLVTIKQAH